MNANELMIHNYVLFEGFPVCVTNVGLTYIEGCLCKNDTLYDVKLKYEDIEPIPITEGLLLRNGFEKEEKWFRVGVGDVRLCVIDLLGIRENQHEPLWRITVEGVMLSQFLNKGTLETNALHQFQNLLSILGVLFELKVKE